MDVSDALRPRDGAMKPAIIAFVLGASLAPTAVLARGCSETRSSLAVGHRRCGRFGDGWNTQSVFARFFDVEIDTGLAFHSLDIAGREVTLCHHAGRSCGEVSSDRFATNASPASLTVAHFSYQGSGIHLGTPCFLAYLPSHRAPTPRPTPTSGGRVSGGEDRAAERAGRG